MKYNYEIKWVKILESWLLELVLAFLSFWEVLHLWLLFDHWVKSLKIGARLEDQEMHKKWDKVFEKGQSKICGRQPWSAEADHTPSNF